MGEPLGLGMSLDDLIAKQREKEVGKGARSGAGGRGQGLAPRGGIQKGGQDRKGFQKGAGPQQQQQHQAFGGGRGGRGAGFQQRGGFAGGRAGGFAGRGGGFAGQQGQQAQGRGFAGRGGGFGGRGAGSGGFGGGHAPMAVAPKQHADTQAYLDEATGNVVVKLKDTEVVTVAPSGDIMLNTGGWFTQTTYDVMNRALNVLQIKVKANGDVRDGNWQVAMGSLLLRFYDGIVLHSKNPATAGQRAPIVLAAMTNPAGAAAAASYAGAAAPHPNAAFMAAAGFGGNPLAASATAASTAMAAAVMARARAALAGAGLGGMGLGAAGAGVGGLGGVSALQQYQALAGLAGLGGSEDTTMMDADMVRRLKAQGRL